MAIVHVGEDNFEAEVLSSAQPVLVDFYADWCGPCKAIAPIVEELSETYAGTCKVCKVDIDKAQGIAEKYSVMSIPTVIFFKGGEPVDQFTGALPKGAIEERVKAAIG